MRPKTGLKTQKFLECMEQLPSCWPWRYICFYITDPKILKSSQSVIEHFYVIVSLFKLSLFSLVLSFLMPLKWCPSRLKQPPIQPSICFTSHSPVGIHGRPYTPINTLKRCVNPTIIYIFLLLLNQEDICSFRSLSLLLKLYCLLSRMP